MQKEAHVYFNTYREISDEVKYFAEQRGYVLVMNFNGDNIHDENPDDVARGISNKVVFFNKGLDITGFIVHRFDGTQNAVPTADGQTAAPRAHGRLCPTNTLAGLFRIAQAGARQGSRLAAW